MVATEQALTALSVDSPESRSDDQHRATLAPQSPRPSRYLLPSPGVTPFRATSIFALALG
jgi:hypothetical protein